jgi:cyanate permease
MIDRRGYRWTVGAGAVLTAAASLVRLDVAHFASLLAGQVGIAVAQPYVVNGIAKLVADWFTGEEAVLGNGLGTVGMFLGMALGMATTPALVDGVGLFATMAINAGVAVVAAVVWFAVVEERGVAEAERPSPMRTLLSNRRLVHLGLLALLGLGYFNALTTWLEQLVAPRGIDAEQAGLVGGAIIVGGIAGAIAVPALADRLRLRKWPLVACVAGAAVFSVAAMLATTYAQLLAAGALLGFAFMPAFALLLAMTAEVVPAHDNGAATSLIMLAGNGGGVLAIVATPMMGGWDTRGPFGFLVALVVATLALALVARETFPGRVEEARRAG